MERAEDFAKETGMAPEEMWVLLDKVYHEDDECATEKADSVLDISMDVIDMDYVKENIEMEEEGFPWD